MSIFQRPGGLAGVRIVKDGRMIKCLGPLYVDQGITVTNDASQGKTVDKVIVSVLRIWKPGNPQAYI
jgi:hypothetical protein